jgi:plastocyanin domain-containing protein
MVNGLWTKECFICMKAKNTLIIAVLIILIIGFGIFLIKDSGAAGSGLNSGEKVQIVKLSVVNGNYVMNPSQVKVGIPVRIEADIAQMPGCSKSFVMPSFNIMKVFTSTDNTVEFTPDKTGVFNVMCSMNMYRGTLTVK